LRNNPCLGCGACCAYYRASFYWAETEEFVPNGVPSHLTEKLNDFFIVMKGTNRPSPYCIALDGTIGCNAHCSIYAQRASVCRDFEPSWYAGQPNDRCDKARLIWGLAPLTPDSWFGPANFPRAA